MRQPQTDGETSTQFNAKLTTSTAENEATGAGGGGGPFSAEAESFSSMFKSSTSFKYSLQTSKYADSTNSENFLTNRELSTGCKRMHAQQNPRAPRCL